MAFIKNNYKIAPLTWLKVGGIVKTLFIPKSLEEIHEFLLTNKDPIIVLGAVSNSLILDGYINSVILKTTNLNKITLLNNYQIEAQCGALDKSISNFALHNNIGGFEFLDSIPGTIGGNVLTNAGCYGSELKDILISAQCLTQQGDLITLTNEDFNFTYRKSSIPHNILMIYSVILQGYPQENPIIKKTMENMEQQRIISQPIGISTCGSTFKNTSTHKAWQLIQAAHGHLLTKNQVKWSNIHCNFLENQGTSANDIYQLCLETQKLVKEKTQQELQLEIFIFGSLI